MNEPGVGPGAFEDFGRAFIDDLHRPAALAAQQRGNRLEVDGILPPKPPPISHGTTVTCETGIRSSSAVCCRAVNEPCVDGPERQVAVLRSTSAVDTCGSM